MRRLLRSLAWWLSPVQAHEPEASTTTVGERFAEAYENYWPTFSPDLACLWLLPQTDPAVEEAQRRPELEAFRLAADEAAATELDVPRFARTVLVDGRSKRLFVDGDEFPWHVLPCWYARDTYNEVPTITVTIPCDRMEIHA